MDLTSWLTEFCGALERSSLGEAVRTAPYAYPILESLHIWGIALLVGSALTVDLRLLGMGRDVLPVTTVARYLLPLCHLGFAVVAVTGAAMFISNAVAVSSSPVAPWKLGLIGIAGMNIVIFHAGIYRSVKRWDISVRPPLRARAAAVLSATAWTGTILAGRLLAY